MRRSPALPTLAATIVALALAGCTGGSTDSASDEVGPLTAFYEKLGGSVGEEEFDAQQRRAEEIIAACMAEQGFEYTPNEPVSAGAVQTDDIDWQSREYAEQYGYGATTGDELWGGSTEEEYVDPNADYIASMSESEQSAFYLALYGEMAEMSEGEIAAEVEEGGEAATEWNWETAGCSGKATHEVYDENNVWSDPAFSEMQEEMSTAYEKLADDPTLREAGKKWATCMADEGYDFSSPDEASQSIWDEQNALWEAASPEPDANGEFDPDASFEPDPAALAELKKKELALAVADWDCKDSSGYSKAFAKANLDLEKRMWEKYGDALEAAAAKQTPAK